MLYIFIVSALSLGLVKFLLCSFLQLVGFGLRFMDRPEILEFFRV